MTDDAVTTFQEAAQIIHAQLNSDHDPDEAMNDLFGNDNSIPAGLMNLVQESTNLETFTLDQVAILARLGTISFLAGMLYERDRRPVRDATK